MKLSDLQKAVVVTEDGRRLGHVFDMRSPGPPEHGGGAPERVVTELVFGALGWLERVGLKPAQGATISWDLVKRIEGRNLIVDRSVTIVHRAELSRSRS